MHLMYTLDNQGKRVYTLKKVQGAEVTKSAHPARFSPDDKYSRHRVTLKKRYGLLITQQSTLYHRLQHLPLARLLVPLRIQMLSKRQRPTISKTLL
ncbi:hypothetical protein D6C97_08313 [Aureobasidium pullulans]|nr:hypothetical protein D6C97_08313 [Aureobasidium pullulans]